VEKWDRKVRKGTNVRAGRKCHGGLKKRRDIFGAVGDGGKLASLSKMRRGRKELWKGGDLIGAYGDRRGYSWGGSGNQQVLKREGEKHLR